MLSSLSDWATEVIDKLGYAGVLLLVALENLFPPIPSEIVLPFAGFVAADGKANLIGMIVAATIGSLIGAWVLFGLAAWIGPVRINRFVTRFGRWFGLTPNDIARSERWFDDHSATSVLICRCIPLIRSLISIPAGFRRMNLTVFTINTAIGSLIWNTALIGAGYLLRDNWDAVEPVLSIVQYIVIALIVAAFIWLVTRRWRTRPAT